MKKHDYQEMQSVYEQWLLSGQSRTVFAQEHGLLPSTFYYWVKKFRRESVVSSGSTPIRGFSRVSVEDTVFSPKNQVQAVIHFPSGVTLELYCRVDVSVLKELTA